jgi:hypothetical protein
MDPTAAKGVRFLWDYGLLWASDLVSGASSIDRRQRFPLQFQGDPPGVASAIDKRLCRRGQFNSNC